MKNKFKITKKNGGYKKLINNKKINKRTSRKINKRTSRKTNKRTSRKINKRTSRKTNKRTSRKTSERISRKINKRTSRKTNKKNSKYLLRGGKGGRRFTPRIINPRRWIKKYMTKQEPKRLDNKYWEQLALTKNYKNKDPEARLNYEQNVKAEYNENKKTITKIKQLLEEKKRNLYNNRNISPKQIIINNKQIEKLEKKLENKIAKGEVYHQAIEIMPSIVAAVQARKEMELQKAKARKNKTTNEIPKGIDGKKDLPTVQSEEPYYLTPNTGSSSTDLDLPLPPTPTVQSLPALPISNPNYTGLPSNVNLATKTNNQQKSNPTYVNLATITNNQQKSNPTYDNINLKKHRGKINQSAAVEASPPNYVVYDDGPNPYMEMNRSPAPLSQSQKPQKVEHSYVNQPLRPPK